MVDDRKLAVGVFNGMAAGALWGMVFLAPALLDGFGPLHLASGRYLVYGLVAVLLLVPRWQVIRAQVGMTQWRELFGLSLLGNLVYFVFLALAVQWAGGAAAALIVGMVPVLVAVWAARTPGNPPLRPLLPSLALCVMGTVLVAWAALQGGGGADVETTIRPLWQRAAGLLAAVAALLSWSIYSLRNVSAMLRNPSLGSHDWSLLTGVATGVLALALLPLAFWFERQGHSSSQWLQFAGISVGLAIGASVIGNACWNRATRSLPLGLGGQMIVFETLFALLYGFVWQQRWPHAVEWLAIASLLAGVILCAQVHTRWRAAT